MTGCSFLAGFGTFTRHLLTNPTYKVEIGQTLCRKKEIDAIEGINEIEEILYFLYCLA